MLLQLPLLASLCTPTAQGSGFEDVTTQMGLQHLQRRRTNQCLIFQDIPGCEMGLMSGGFATGDVNDDGFPDLYLTALGGSDSLFLNLAGTGFWNVAPLAGLDQPLQSNGAHFVDIDNDGDQDLIVTVMGAPGDPVNNRHRLFVRYPGGFEEEGIERGMGLPVAEGINGWSIASGDYDRDGWVDLYLCSWMPQATSGSMLLRNLGASSPGYFEDVTAVAGLVGPAGSGALGEIGDYAFAATFCDLDQDGWQDLALASDFGHSLLFWNDRDGTFTNGTVPAGVGTDENGMGSAFGDFDRDGDLDWFVTSIFEAVPSCVSGGCGWASSGNRLYEYLGNRLFADSTDAAGVRDCDWGWGAAFFDLENDGDLDLAATNGVRFDNPLALPFHTDRTRLWVRQSGLPFAELAGPYGIDDKGSGKGLASFDFDRDGDQDLLIARNSARPLLLRNDLPTGAWLQVAVQGTFSNRDAKGAVVRVTPRAGEIPLIQEVGVGAHFLAQDDPALHFGLGPDVDLVHRIEVTFPASGIIRVLSEVSVDQRITVIE